MNKSTSESIRDRLFSIVLAGAGYYIAGRLGLLLAIPPGYATAVWPPSGIALAMVLLRGYGVWPGILIGSFFVNVGTSFDAGSTASIIKSLLIAFSIGAGAALEAVVGGALIRRLVGYSNILIQELDAVRMLLLGGPLSCVVNATVGVTTLWAVGLIPAPNFLFNWWTWWVGDSIGVIIFTPLVLVWSLRPWREWFRRQVSLTIPLVIMFALVVVLFFFTSYREKVRIQVEFDKQAESYANEAEGDVDNYLDILQALEGFYASSHSVERDEFHIFASHLLKRQPDVLALSWNPRVLSAERKSFEESVHKDGLTGFRIVSPDSQGRLLPTDSRAEYFPVDYIEPAQGNEKALGLDVGFDPSRHRALDRARDTGLSSATRPINLVQLTPAQMGMVVYAPIYRNGVPHDTLEERRRNLQGYVAAAFNFDSIMKDDLKQMHTSGIQLRVFDVTSTQNPVLIFSANNVPGEAEKSGGLHRSVPLDMAGRQWRLRFYMSPDYLVANRSWQAWGLLAAGLLFTGLLGLFLLVVIGRATRVEDLVSRRTNELQRANENLSTEVLERKRLENEAQQKATELAQKNEELEQFAYVASHDLQAPLRGVTGFAQLLQRDYAEKLGQEGQEFISFIIQGSSQMHQLIGDLLQLSRIKAQPDQMTAVDCRELVQQVRESLKFDLEKAGAEIIFNDLPKVWGEQGQLTQLFQNLIGNAIKFQRAGSKPSVEITAALEQKHWHFRVADNGIGIPADQLQRIFVIFSRLHTTDEYPGTGMGLAICKKIVERHGGRIWVESAPGKGSTFHFTLSAVQ